MSRGLEEIGLDRKVSYTKNFTNFIQPVAGFGDAVVDASAQAFNYLTNRLTPLNILLKISEANLTGAI